MSFVPVFQYMLGIGVFGVGYWLLNGILELFIGANVHETGNVYTLMMYLWTGSIIIYLIFGGYWMIRKYNESEYRREF